MVKKNAPKRKPVLSKADIKRINAAVRKEFPEDPALQWVHYARMRIAREAELAGMTLYEYHVYLADQREKARKHAT